MIVSVASFMAAVVCFAGWAAAQPVNQTPLEYRAIERRLDSLVGECLSKPDYPQAFACADSIYERCIDDSPDGETTAGFAICGSVSANALDRGLNTVWGALKRDMPRAEFSMLLAEQRDWLKTRELEASKAAKEHEGGSMGAYTGWGVYVSMSAERVARLTEVRNGL